MADGVHPGGKGRDGATGRESEHQDDLRTPPGPGLKNWLTPYLLLHLKYWNVHGYELIQRLMAMGLGPIDPGAVYRTLRQLEKEGMVASSWVTAEKGPARRQYTLTEAGDSFLSAWAEALEQYRQALDKFFQLYTQPPSKGGGISGKGQDP